MLKRMIILISVILVASILMGDSAPVKKTINNNSVISIEEEFGIKFVE